MNFYWEIYRELNPDLIEAGLNTRQQVENHYRINGMREKRKIYIKDMYPGFNPNLYKNNYADLKNLNDIQVSLHWLRNGRKEGRSYMPINKIVNKYDYTFKFSYDRKVLNNKLFYCLVFKNSLDIIINTNRILVSNSQLKYNNNLKSGIIIKDNNKLIIRKNGNRYTLIVNNTNLDNIDSISKIYLENNNAYKLNIVFPISLIMQGRETMVNFDYIIAKYITYAKQNNFQLSICHTEKDNFGILDNLILGNDINYIFVANPLNFNLGYCRNIYKYINLSNNVLYNDIDIPLELSSINKMLSKIDTHDIIKPYLNSLYQLTRDDKYKYIKKTGDIRLDTYTKYSKYSITGGVTMFKNRILIDTGGYEEFNSYGFEDRCLDVIVLAKKYKVFYTNDVVYHLYHEKNNISDSMKSYIELAKRYTINNYGCGMKQGIWYMHDSCSHKNHNVNNIINKNKLYNADINIFRTKYRTINLKPF